MAATLQNTTTSYKVSSLSPKEIEQDLVDYLKYQKKFSDYNFEGSGLKVITRLLAYNTFYNNVYDNFALNESFLDSAVKRESVVSHANMLDYTPRSAQASTSLVNMTVVDSGTDLQDSLYLAPHTPFSANINGQSFVFSNEAGMVAHRVDNTYTFYNVVLKEGIWISTAQEYRGNAQEKFVIENENVDLTTLSVQVYTNYGSGEYETFTLAENLLELTPTSPVYHLECGLDGKYVVRFGNGYLGKSLSVGNVVKITYLACSADAPNGANSFSFAGEFTRPTCRALVSTITVAAGGVEPEDIEDIRWNAPHMYTLQNRCVTANDYSTFVKANFANCRAVTSWGGEDNIPVRYGQAFISVIPKTGTKLTRSEKERIIAMLKDKKVLTTVINVVDADYIRVGIDMVVYYNPNIAAGSTSEDVSLLARGAILQYNEENLRNFNSLVRCSALQRAVDNADPSIQNNSIRIWIIRDMPVTLGERLDYTCNVCNPIYKPINENKSVVSSGFQTSVTGDLTVFLRDDPITETFTMYYYNADGNAVDLIRNIGSIDYENGVLKVTDLTITAYDGEGIQFTVIPSSTDVMSAKNMFAFIDEANLTVSARPVVNNSDFTQSPNF